LEESIMENRCTKCILPTDYLGISFDVHGVCSLCNSYAKRTYPGPEEMRKKVREILDRRPDRGFDCVLGVSGGRDSSFLLHFLKNELGLNPLAYFIDHDFIPDHTRENVHTITKKVGVKLVVEKSKILRHCFYTQFNAWKKRPSPATISSFCMGCKSRVLLMDYKMAIRHKIPLIINGGTPYEYASYKTELMKMVPGSSRRRSYAAGYLHQVAKNPSLVTDPYCFLMQGVEFFTHLNFNPAAHRLVRSLYRISFIDPYWMFIRWDEKQVMSTLKEKLDWKNFPGMKTTWRGDCYIGPIRQFLYYAMLGYSDKDAHLSALVRDGQITRAEALERITEENESSLDSVKVCCGKIGINVDDVKAIVDKYGKVKWR
jgi:hypothetical protein